MASSANSTATRSLRGAKEVVADGLAGAPDVGGELFEVGRLARDDALVFGDMEGSTATASSRQPRPAVRGKTRAIRGRLRGEPDRDRRQDATSLCEGRDQRQPGLVGRVGLTSSARAGGVRQVAQIAYEVNVVAELVSLFSPDFQLVPLAGNGWVVFISIRRLVVFDD